MTDKLALSGTFLILGLLLGLDVALNRSLKAALLGGALVTACVALPWIAR